tara:strand:- start:190 stop:690 length:501 start_codon:yes stop_codon:yes gene_type:complete
LAYSPSSSPELVYYDNSRNRNVNPSNLCYSLGYLNVLGYDRLVNPYPTIYLTTTNGAYMSSSQSFIQSSPTHNGAFIVVHSDGTTVPCHNLTTAKIEAGILHLGSTARSSAPEQLTVEEYYGCVLGGLGYTPAVTWTITGRVERCHNWATARTIVNDNEKLRSSVS